MQCQGVEQGKIHTSLPFRRQGQICGVRSRKTPGARQEDVSRVHWNIHDQLESFWQAHKSLTLTAFFTPSILTIIQQADGTYRFSYVGSDKPPLPHIDTVRDTGSVVRAALQSAPGKTILGAGSMLSWIDLGKSWCEVNKVPSGGYDETPIEVFEKYMPMPDLRREFGEMFLFFDEFGYTGGEEGVVNAKDVGSFR